MAKLEQVKNLETGKGIKYLLDEGYKIFGNPIVMFDTNYSLIACTDVANDDPLWNELVTTGTFNAAEQEFFFKERFTEDVANADKLAVMRSDKLKYDRILGNIFNSENIKVANIVMVECLSPFDADTSDAFEAFSDKITGEIHNDVHYTEYGRSYHENLIKMLLDAQIKDDGFYTAHMQILYDGFEEYLNLAVVEVIRDGQNRDRLLFFRDLLKNRYPSFKFAIYSGYVIMIISSSNKNFSREWILNDHENPFEQNDIYAGISSSFENLFDLRKYYDEALSALKSGIAAGRRVFSCSEN